MLLPSFSILLKYKSQNYTNSPTLLLFHHQKNKPVKNQFKTFIILTGKGRNEINSLLNLNYL